MNINKNNSKARREEMIFLKNISILVEIKETENLCIIGDLEIKHLPEEILRKTYENVN